MKTNSSWDFFNDSIEPMPYTGAAIAAIAGITSFFSGLGAGFFGAFGTLLVPGCAAAAGGALNVFGACFIGECILSLPLTLAINWAEQKSRNANHIAQTTFWFSLALSLGGALVLGSAAIGSGILGVSAIYEVAACRLSGAIAFQLIAKIFGMMANSFVGSLSQDFEQPSLSGRNLHNFH